MVSEKGVSDISGMFFLVPRYPFADDKPLLYQGLFLFQLGRVYVLVHSGQE